MKNPSNWTIGFSLTILLSITLGIYSAALGNVFNYDDLANLSRLGQVKDLSSGLSFIFAGESGPLGRPIAMATFAAQASAWPNSPHEFLFVNILIHLINGLLLAWLGWYLCQINSKLKGVALPFGATLSVLWLLQPLLASACLMIVQRMTTLCTTFMLLGLIGYLAGRLRILQHARGGRTVMLGSLGLFGILAILTKETGALLPIYAWVLEYTLLPLPPEQRFLSWWRRLLNCPVIILLGYMALQLPHIFDVSVRGFSSWQRLLTEGLILWHYLYLLLLPRAADMGPFHDDWMAAQTLDQSPEAALAWVGLIIIAVLAIVKRRSWPWLSLAIGWFILGHALESTVFSLELYFEHRNYLPSVGILLALTAGFWQIPNIYKRTAFGIAAMYVCLLGFVLYQVTAAWGNPFVAGQLWAEKHPDSARAQQFLANRLLSKGDTGGALQLISNFYVRYPERLGFGLQKIQLLCESGENVYQAIHDLIPLINNAPMDHSMADTMEKLMVLSETNKCPGLNKIETHKLLDALLQNNVILSLPSAQFRLHHLKARLYFQSHALDPTMKELEAAFKILPDLDTGVLMAGILTTAGLPEQAREKLRIVRQFLPNNPVLRQQWLNRLSEIEADLNHNPDNITILMPEK